MSIPVKCPACQHAFAVADRFAGKKGKCPKCGMIFRAGETSAAGADVEVFPDVAPDPGGPPPPKRKSAPAPPLVSDTGAVDTFPDLDAASQMLPVGTPVASQSAPATFAVAPSSEPSASTATATTRRSKSTPLPVMIGGAVALLAIVGVVIGLIWAVQNGKSVTKKGPAQQPGVAEPSNESPEAPPNTENSSTNSNNSSAPPPPVKFDLAALAPLRPRVYALEVKTAQGTTKAMCFPIADGGYAVTAYHAIAQAVSAEAVTPDNVRIPVGGTFSTDPAHDLAIIQLLPSLPVPIERLPIHSGSEFVDAEIAAVEVTNAKDLVPGRFKSTDSLSQLSPTVRNRLKALSSDWADDASIVLHSIKLSADCAGSPIINKQGGVIGVQLAPDPAGGVAVHVRHIIELMERTGKDVKQFAAGGVAAADPMPKPPITTPEPAPPVEPNPKPNPFSPDPEPAPPAATDDPADDIIARIKEHRDACEKFSWKAADATEYAQFQLLAKFIHDAQTLADEAGTAADVKTKLEAAIQEALAALTPDKWPDEEGWKKTGEVAMNALTSTPGQGFFAVARVVHPTKDLVVNDIPSIAAEVDGASRMVIVPMKAGGDKLPVDTKVLIIGIHDPTAIIRIRNIDMPLVRAKYVIAVTK